jgi:hypothetical protein
MSVKCYPSHLWKSVRTREFENKMLSRIFGPKREDITGGCRKLHNQGLHN